MGLAVDKLNGSRKVIFIPLGIFIQKHFNYLTTRRSTFKGYILQESYKTIVYWTNQLLGDDLFTGALIDLLIS